MDEDIVSGGVAGGFALAGGEFGDGSVFGHLEGGAVGEGPPAEADDVVVFGPVGEGVVAGMEDEDAAAVFDEVDEVGFGLVVPCGGGALGDVVAGLNDDVGVGEVGVPGVEVGGGGGGRSGGDGDVEEAGGLEEAAEEFGVEFPVVVGEAVEEEDADFWGWRGWDRERGIGRRRGEGGGRGRGR